MKSLKDLEHKVNVLQDEVSKAKEVNNKQSNDLVSLRDDLKTRDRDLARSHTDKDVLQSACEKYKQEIVRLEGINTDLEDTTNSLQSSGKVHEQRVRDLEASLATTQAESGRLSSELTTTTTHLNQSKTALQQEQRRTAGLNSSLRAANIRLEVKDAFVDELSEKIRDLEDLLQQRKNESLAIQAADSEEIDSLRASLNANQSQMTDDHTTFRKQNDAFASEIQRLNIKLAHANDIERRLNFQMQTKSDEIQQLQSVVREEGMAKEAAEGRARDAQAEVTSSGQTITSLRERLATEEENHTTTKRRLDETRKAVTSIRQELTTEHDRHQLTHHELKETNERKTSLEQQLASQQEASREEVKGLKEKHRTEQQKLKKLRSDAQAKLDRSTFLVDDLKEQHTRDLQACKTKHQLQLTTYVLETNRTLEPMLISGLEELGLQSQELMTSLGLDTSDMGDCLSIDLEDMDNFLEQAEMECQSFQQ